MAPGKLFNFNKWSEMSDAEKRQQETKTINSAIWFGLMLFFWFLMMIAGAILRLPRIETGEIIMDNGDKFSYSCTSSLMHSDINYINYNISINALREYEYRIYWDSDWVYRIFQWFHLAFLHYALFAFLYYWL